MKYVNEKKQQSWFDIASIQIGGVICLPMIVAGVEIARLFGFARAVLAICIGNGLLCCLAFIGADMSFKKRLTTVENARNYFGDLGGYIFSGSLIVGLVGWFAVQLNLIGISVIQIISVIIGSTMINISWIINIFIGFTISISCMFGIEIIKRLAECVMIPLIGTLAYLVYISSGKPFVSTVISQQESSIVRGIALVIAISIFAVVDMPTFYRFARSKLDAQIGALIVFLCAAPLVQLVGVYVALHSVGSDIVSLMMSSAGYIGTLWLLSFLVFAGWTTNNTNLYSSANALQFFLPNVSYWLRSFLLGLFGSLLSIFDIMGNFEMILHFMGIVSCSIGAVVTTRYALNFLIPGLYLAEIKMYNCNIFSWLVGLCCGFVSLFYQVGITGFAAFDAFFMAMFATVFLTIIQKTKLKEFICKK